jgi:hypothetical protein
MGNKDRGFGTSDRRFCIDHEELLYVLSRPL